MSLAPNEIGVGPAETTRVKDPDACCWYKARKPVALAPLALRLSTKTPSLLTVIGPGMLKGSPASAWVSPAEKGNWPGYISG
jgi:hypothetical protein